MKTTSIVFVAVSFISTTGALAQDQRWGFELRPAVNFPTQDLGTAELGTGFGAEGTFSYRFMDHLQAYVGWGWNQFSPKNATDNHFEETGYTFGLEFVHPISDRVNYMLGAGGIYNHIELENADGDITGDTGHGFGWQAEAGVALKLGTRWMVTPSVRYRSLPAELKVGALSTDLDLNYISAGVGVAILF